MVRFFLILVVVLFSISAWSLQAASAEFCTKLMRMVSFGVAGDGRIANELSESGFFSPGTEGYELESDVIALYELAPELRNLKSFADKWSLTEQQAQDVLIFYSWAVLAEPLDVAGQPEQVWERIRRLTRVYTLSLSEQPLRFRYGYYRLNAGAKSVPEMAAELEISESEVRHDLSRLRLSTLEALQKQLDKVDKSGHLDAKGRVKTKSLLEAAGITDQAWAFFEHAVGDGNRGVSWARVIEAEGMFWIEEDYLRELFARDLSVREMAKELNRLSNTSDSSDSNYRTETAVQQKLKALGLTKVNRQGEKFLEWPIYGVLKDKGVLQEEAVLNFLRDHRGRAIDDLAKFLDVESDSLRKFLRRHFVPLYLFGESGVASSERVERYRKQIDLVEKAKGVSTDEVFFWDWRAAEFPDRVSYWLALKAKNPSLKLYDLPSLLNKKWQEALTEEEAEVLRPIWRDEVHALIDKWNKEQDPDGPIREPKQTDFGSTEGKIPINYARLMGQGAYDSGGAQENLALYSSSLEFWKDRKKRDPSTQLLAVKFQDLSPEEAEELRPIWRDEAHALIDKWKDNNSGREPELTKGLGSEEGLNYRRLMGQGDYDSGGAQENWALYSSSVEFWKDRKKRDPSTQLLAVQFYKLSAEEAEELRPIWRDEAHALIDKWKKEQDPDGPIREPKPREDFGSTEGQIPINYERLMGQGAYASGGDRENLALYSSKVEFWKDRKKRDPSTQLLAVQFRDLSAEEAEELRPIWRDEVHALIDKWKESNSGREPELGSIKGQIPINYERLMGQGRYASGGARENLALYSSREEFLADREARRVADLP